MKIAGSNILKAVQTALDTIEHLAGSVTLEEWALEIRDGKSLVIVNASARSGRAYVEEARL